jgi:hypothetical protein
MPNVFDLDNALVYYVDRILPGTPRGGFADIISVINSSGIDLAFAGSPGDVVYNPSPNNPNLPFTTDSFFGADFTNDTDAVDKQIFTRSTSETASFSLAFTEGIKVGAKTTVVTKIPFIAEGKVELSAEGSFSSTQTETSSQTQTFTFSQEIPVPPRKRVVTTVLLDLLKYTGTVTTKVQVSGRISIAFGSTRVNMDVVDIFRAIKNQPPGNYRKKDDRTTYSFTDGDLALFEVTANELLYTATAALQAKFAGRARTVATQYDLPSGLMENEFTL